MIVFYYLSCKGGALGPDEICELTYAWGLGMATNNQAEALAMWKGIEITIDKGNTKLIISGDTKILIHGLVKK